MFPLVGFKSTSVFYKREERLAGKSHYPLKKMIALAVDGITSLMDGQPTVTPEGIPVMEVSAVVSQVSGASVQYDDRIGALRITI